MSRVHTPRWLAERRLRLEGRARQYWAGPQVVDPLPRGYDARHDAQVTREQVAEESQRALELAHEVVA